MNWHGGRPLEMAMQGGIVHGEGPRGQALWLSEMGQMCNVGNGWRNELAGSSAAVKVASAKDLKDMPVWGGHASVTAMRSALVADTHTR
jgi:hypothetical protein